jgi:hypothetical protein
MTDTLSKRFGGVTFEGAKQNDVSIEEAQHLQTENRGSYSKIFSAHVGRPAPSFIGYQEGNIFPLPQNSWGPFPTRSSGVIYTGGPGGNGLSEKVTSVRFMDQTRNHAPRVVYSDKMGHKINPINGKQIPNSDPAAHLKPHGKNEI